MEPAEERRVVVDFSRSGEAGTWQAIDDAVMGGLSSSRLEETGEGTARFAGRVSLENNGGFASVRRAPQRHDLSGYTGIELRVRGDGKRYRFRLRMDDRFDGVAWQAGFETAAGAWQTLRLPFSSFEPSFRGRRVPGADPLDPGRVRQLGFLIAEKQEGGFALEIESIAAYREPGGQDRPGPSSR